MYKPQQLGYFSEKRLPKANDTMCSFLLWVLLIQIDGKMTDMAMAPIHKHSFWRKQQPFSLPHFLLISLAEEEPSLSHVA